MRSYLANRHFRLWRLRRANRRRVEGRGWGGWVGLAGLVALYPSFEGVFWFGLSGSAVDATLSGVSYRMALLIFGASSLDVYSRVLRADDRQVIDLLPVSGAEVVQAELMSVLWRRAWWVPALAFLALPVALQVGVWPWLAIVLFLTGVQLCSLGAVAAAFGSAVNMALNPKYAALLDAARGANAREQAALIYAPGAALFLFGGFYGGVVAFLSSAPSVFDLVALSTPALIAPLVWSLALRRAEQAWARSATLLNEIDARYAAIEEPVDQAEVYLDWAIRGLSPSVRRWALKDLRNGWRAHRAFITASWLIGLVGAAGVWSSSLPWRPVFFVGLSLWPLGLSGYALDRDEPVFFRLWLKEHAGDRLMARAVVLFLWAQSAVCLVGAALLTRHGLGHARLFFALEGMAAFSALMSASVLSRLGPVAYMGLGLVVASLAITVGAL